MDKIYVRPAIVGAPIPDPVSGDVLKPEGEWKPRSPAWLRLVMREDVVEGDPPREDPPPEAPEPCLAVHRGGGSYSVMRDGAELVEKLTKLEAEAFNALDEDGRAAFLSAHQPA